MGAARLPSEGRPFKGGLFGQMRRSSSAFGQLAGKGGETLAQNLLDVGGWATHLAYIFLERLKDRTIDMAKPSIGEFVNQVKTESRKIVWPTRRETVQTTILVLIMTTLLSIFFLGVDTVFNAIVSWLTSLAR